MPTIEVFLSHGVVVRLSWTLVHSLWQGAAVALVAAAILAALRNARPHARYTVACAALGIMATLPFVTMHFITSPGPVAEGDSMATAPPETPMPPMPIVALDELPETSGMRSSCSALGVKGR